MKAIEKAREHDRLEEVQGKDGLFIVKDLSEKRTGDSYFLDLRNGFNFYGYDSEGEQITGEDKERPNMAVKEVRSHYNAQGSTSLKDFEVMNK